MASLTLQGSTSGQITLATPAVAGTNTITLPAATGTLVTSESASISGNLTFTGTGNRITGDMSNATVANRVAFQTSTANSSTIVSAIPSGTGTAGQFAAYNNSDPTNSSALVLSSLSTEARVAAGIAGTGTYLPMTFLTGGSERMRIDTSGNVGIGTTSPSYKLDVQQNGNLNATVGISNTTAGTSSLARFVAISDAGSAAFGFTSSSYTDITGAADALLLNANSASGGMAFALDGVVKMKMDSSGNVGIGTTSPNVGGTNTNNSVLTIKGKAAPYNGILEFQNYGTTGNDQTLGWIRFFDNTTENAAIEADRATSSSTGYIKFSTNGGSGNTERMRIDSLGNMLVGTNNSIFANQSTSLQVKGISSVSSTRNASVIMSQGYSSSAGLPEYVGNWASSGYWGIGPDSGSNDSTVKIGIVSADASGAYWGGYANVKGGTYTNASDYRLKENVVNYADGALSKVLALRPVNYNVIPIPHEDKDGPIPVVKTEVGFLAHELQQHIPELVYGEKDALNTDGTPNMQSVDYAKMTAVLVKAIQELKAELDALKGAQ